VSLQIFVLPASARCRPAPKAEELLFGVVAFQPPPAHARWPFFWNALSAAIPGKPGVRKAASFLFLFGWQLVFGRSLVLHYIMASSRGNSRDP
jgi:hypothetical protein